MKSDRERKAALHHLELDTLREKVVQLITLNPAKAALILTDWINQSPKRKTKKKAA